jgi:hypothetical protein
MTLEDNRPLPAKGVCVEEFFEIIFSDIAAYQRLATSLG